MQNETQRCNTLQHIAIHCNTLQRTATHCNTAEKLLAGIKVEPDQKECVTIFFRCQCVAACCSLLQCVAVCCSVLQYKECGTISSRSFSGVMCAIWHMILGALVYISQRVLQCVAVCCSVLQCVAVCCSILCVVDLHMILGAYVYIS